MSVGGLEEKSGKHGESDKMQISALLGEGDGITVITTSLG